MLLRCRNYSKFHNELTDGLYETTLHWHSWVDFFEFMLRV
jgi:hypothetical protein